ncbi:MAG TPA: AMP phosphorylase [Candidatus Nanoarchaeia archaeon]|nr:AMP phosphorylase [Candidatus Nanoarchaeia archaeon]
MKLGVKSLFLDAGRPIALLPEHIAEKLNAHVGDRILIKSGKKSVIATLDLVKKIVTGRHISLSEEIVSYLKVKSNASVDVMLAPQPRSLESIMKKVAGKELKKEELKTILTDIVTNALTEAEIAYFVAAVYEQGMSFKETLYLTESMYTTGRILKWSKKIIADKHSIGGIPGNRTTPIVVSILVAAGLTVPKTSSRAITSAAGTADVIETLAKVDFSADELQRIVNKTGGCLAWGGALGLAPADDKLIRVERMLDVDPEPQLLASIMGKKLAVGSTHVLIDIPAGTGAKVSLSHAERLKKKFTSIGNHFNLKTDIIITTGSEPIGNGIGPVLEMIDVLAVLKQKNSPLDLEKKAVMLAGRILELTATSPKGEGLKKAKELLETGKAFEKFREIIKAQQGTIKEPTPGTHKKNILATKSGRLIHIDNKKINFLARLLGSPADKRAGIYLYHHLSETISKGQPLMTLYAESPRKLTEAMNYLQRSILFRID